jgi:adenine deaminase
MLLGFLALAIIAKLRTSGRGVIDIATLSLVRLWLNGGKEKATLFQ